ncbi:MAG: hypothetical protein IKQ61_07050 [Spirochaetales bacterium]|nr:hypothetical protein [Spirochaetales bacterium]
MGIFKSIGKGVFDALIGNPMKEMDKGLTGGMFGKIINNAKKSPDEKRKRDEDNDSQRKKTNEKQEKKMGIHGYLTYTNMPSIMCQSCKHYYYDTKTVHSSKYCCDGDRGFRNWDNINWDPNNDGTCAKCDNFEPM